MNPATRRGMTARMQDIINDIRIHEGDDTPIGWVIQGDTLRVVQPMAAWGEEESQIIDPDTILVRSWTADHDSGDLTPEGSWTLPNPIDQNLRGPTDTYADRVLGAAVFDLDKHDDRQITAQGASAGGAITLEDPISGGALPSGWRDAMREAVARATAVDPDLVRASYLQQPSMPCRVPPPGPSRRKAATCMSWPGTTWTHPRAPPTTSPTSSTRSKTACQASRPSAPRGNPSVPRQDRWTISG